MARIEMPSAALGLEADDTHDDERRNQQNIVGRRDALEPPDDILSILRPVISAARGAADLVGQYISADRKKEQNAREMIDELKIAGRYVETRLCLPPEH